MTVHHSLEHLPLSGSKFLWVRWLPKVCSQRSSMSETFCQRRLMCQHMTRGTLLIPAPDWLTHGPLWPDTRWYKLECLSPSMPVAGLQQEQLLFEERKPSLATWQLSPCPSQKNLGRGGTLLPWTQSSTIATINYRWWQGTWKSWSTMLIPVASKNGLISTCMW